MTSFFDITNPFSYDANLDSIAATSPLSKLSAITKDEFALSPNLAHASFKNESWLAMQWKLSIHRIRSKVFPQSSF